MILREIFGLLTIFRVSLPSQSWVAIFLLSIPLNFYPSNLIQYQSVINMHHSLHRAILCLIANFSVLAAGMGLAFPSISTNQLLTELNSEQVSWFASITAIACPFGGLISGYVCEKFGRKGSLIFIDVIAIVSWLLLGLSNFSGEYLFIQLLIARLLIGFNIGMSTTPAVMYTAEVCDPALRGRLTMLSSPFFTATGMVMTYFLGAVVSVSWFLRLKFRIWG